MFYSFCVPRKGEKKFEKKEFEKSILEETRKQTPPLIFGLGDAGVLDDSIGPQSRDGHICRQAVLR